MAHYIFGSSYEGLGDYGGAEKAYKEVVRLDPDSNVTWSDLGDLYRKQGRWKDAVGAYQQALRIEPGMINAHYGLGVAYVNLGEREAALKEYQFLKNGLAEKEAEDLYRLINK